MIRTRFLVLTAAVAGILLLLGAACDELVTETIEITTAGHPTAEFGFSPDGGCTPLTVSFDASPSSGPITMMIFDFGDSTSDTIDIAAGEDDSLTHTYDEPGSYRVVLTVFDDQEGSDAEAKPRAVIAGNSLDSLIVSDTLVCPNVPVEFTAVNPAGVSAWRWDFGDGDVITDPSPTQTHEYTEPGVYPFELRLTSDSCGTLYEYDTVHVLHCPESGFTMDQSAGCEPLTVIFDGPPVEILDAEDNIVGSIIEWQWEFGNGTFGAGMADTVEYDAGDYEVMLTVTTDSGAVKTFTDSLTVWPASSGFTATPATGCDYDKYQFVVAFKRTAVGDTAWFWDFGDGDTSNLQNPYHVYSDPGRYSVSLVARGACGADSDFVSMPNLITMYDLLDHAGFTAVVTPETDSAVVEFTDTTTTIIPVTSWEWDFGDGGAVSSGDDLSTVTHKYALGESDPYKVGVLLTIDNGCNVAFETDSVTIPAKTTAK